MVKLAHSYSSLKTFENCPKNYYHQRVAKDIKDAGGAASIYGDRVHKQMDERMRDKTPLPAESAMHEDLCKAFEAMPGILLSEKEMTLTEQLKPTGWWDSDAWLRSKLDVLVLYEEQSMAVVGDWKTGKRRPDTFQLELSALMIFKHYPQIATVSTAFIWLKDRKIDKATYSRLDAVVLWSKLLGKINRIEDALEKDVWPAKPSGLCPYCPAKNICEFALIR